MSRSSFSRNALLAHLLLLTASPSLVLTFGWVPGYGHSEGQQFISADVVGTGRPRFDPNLYCESDAWFWPRQTFCGPGVGVCDDGFCCSGDGYVKTRKKPRKGILLFIEFVLSTICIQRLISLTKRCTDPPCPSFLRRCSKHAQDCLAPNCQLDYGPGCYGNQGPRSGVDTSLVDRPRLGRLPYGGGRGATIRACTEPGTVAVTYDDGPSFYTADLLDLLRERHPHARVTFFVVGNNGGRGDLNDPAMPWPGLLRRMVAEGHQIASHTWTHEDGDRLDEARMTEQMVWTEVALHDVLGLFPTYMRPPYSACPAETCGRVMERLGYHVVHQNVNNEDWRWNDRGTIQNAKDNWDEVMRRGDPRTEGFITLEHDVFYQTVYNLTDYLFTTMRERGWRAVTVGECLGDPKENWYRAGPPRVPR